MKNIARNLSIIFLLILLTLTGIIPAKAQGIIIGDTVPEGQVVLSNVILFGDTVTISGDIDGDVFAIGRQIVIDGDISGSGIVLGQVMEINGTFEGSLYAGAQSTLLADPSNLVYDLYFIGLQLTCQADSSIGRDILIIALGANLQCDVGRDVRGLIGPIPIIQAILDLFGKSIPFLESGNLTGMKDNLFQLPSVELSQQGNPQTWSSLRWKDASMALLGLPDLVSERGSLQEKTVNSSEVVDWLLIQLRSIIHVFVYSAIAMLIFPKFFQQTAEKIWQRPGSSTGIGLLAVIFIFSATLLIAILLIPLILFFSKLTLISFSVFTFIIGYTSLTLCGAIIYLFSVFVTKGIAGSLVFQKIFGRLAPSMVRYRFMMLFLGTVLYVLLRSIPYLGVLIGIWISLLGLGAAWLVWIENRNAARKISSEQSTP